MKRLAPAWAIVALCGCAHTDARDTVRWPDGAFGADDGRQKICVRLADFAGDAYGKAAYLSGVRDAFAETEFLLERRGLDPDTWSPDGALASRFRLALCDSAPGAWQMTITLGITTPRMENQVATPWGDRFQLGGVDCQWSLPPQPLAADSVAMERFSVYYRDWTMRQALTADMGRRLGETLLERLHRRRGLIDSEVRFAASPEAMVLPP